MFTPQVFNNTLTVDLSRLRLIIFLTQIQLRTRLHLLQSLPLESILLGGHTGCQEGRAYSGRTNIEQMKLHRFNFTLLGMGRWHSDFASQISADKLQASCPSYP